jgi:hypothetical protein
MSRLAARLRSLLQPAAMLLIGGGCATTWEPGTSAPRQSQPQVNLSGYSAAFREGYNDGCDSARATLRRDEKRFLGDSDYKMGWNDGHSICQRRPLGR